MFFCPGAKNHVKRIGVWENLTNDKRIVHRKRAGNEK
jgi:hypothetical protein